jgi:hypothetical protein
MSERPPPYPPPSGAPPPAVYAPYPAYPPRIATDGQATAALVLGVVGVLCCGIFGPVAYLIGEASLNRIRASSGALGGSSQARAGRILGVVGTVEFGLAILFLIFTLIANTR